MCERNDIKWPDGYCLDPNGKMCIPEGKADDFNFGYEIGFLDAWGIMNSAIKDARVEIANRVTHNAKLNGERSESARTTGSTAG